MIQSYFTNIRQAIIQQLSIATTEINIAVCWFTNLELFEVLCQKLRNGVNVNVIILNDGINNKLEGLDFQKFINLNGNFYFSNIDKPVHDKYCIIDNKVLITGSYNWTYYAENNYENIVITTEQDVINEFMIDYLRLIKNCSPKILNVNESANRLVDQMTIVESDTQFVLKQRLGFSTLGDVFLTVIPKRVLFSKHNLPMSFSQNTVTSYDNQEEISADILYGDNTKASLNESLGKFVINNIPPKPKGQIHIITTFSIDRYKILTVTKQIKENLHIQRNQYKISNLF